MGAVRFVTNDGKVIRVRSEEFDEMVIEPIRWEYEEGKITREEAIKQAVIACKGWPIGGPQDPESKRRNAAQFLWPEEFDQSPY